MSSRLLCLARIFASPGSLLLTCLLVSCTTQPQSTSRTTDLKTFSVQESEIPKTSVKKTHHELEPADETVPAQLKPSGEKTIVSADDNNGEMYITIQGQKYKIPRQWQGKRLASPAFTFEDLEMIPLHLTAHETKLYLLPEANAALMEMAREASAHGVELKVHSSYRSEWYQRKIVMKMMKKGRDFDDIIRYVAPPGYSEHMLGTVVDFYPSNWEFARTPAYLWLKEHAADFNFYESYPQDQPENMPWEAWHWRWFPSDVN